MIYVGWVILIAILIIIMLTLNGVSRKLDGLSDDRISDRGELRKILERIAAMRGDLERIPSMDHRVTIGGIPMFHRFGPGCNHHHCASVINQNVF